MPGTSLVWTSDGERSLFQKDLFDMSRPLDLNDACIVRPALSGSGTMGNAM